MPRVSIVMPAYQTERFISASIQSILAQTYSDFELLVVDDGSSDRTAQHVESFRDRRVRCLQQTNAGAPTARNRGIGASSGELIAVTDSDDLWHPNKLNAQINLIDQRPSVGVVYTFCSSIDEFGREMGITQRHGSGIPLTLPEILCSCPIWTPSSVLMRRQTLEQVAARTKGGHYFDPSLKTTDDFDLWCRIALLTPWGICGLQQVLTYYRIRRSGLCATQSQNGKDTQNFLQFWNNLLQIAPINATPWQSLSLAYHLRAQAQRAYLYRMPHQNALQLMARAVFTDPTMLRQEPLPTLLITGAAFYHELFIRERRVKSDLKRESTA